MLKINAVRRNLSFRNEEMEFRSLCTELIVSILDLILNYQMEISGRGNTRRSGSSKKPGR